MVLQIYTIGDDCAHCKSLIKWLDAEGVNYKLVNLNQYNKESRNG